MKQQRVLSFTIMSLILAVPAALAQTGPRGRQVTDPNELASYGFPPDTILFIAPNAEVIQRPGGLARDELKALRRAAAGNAARSLGGKVVYLSYDASMLRSQHSEIDGRTPDFVGYFPDANIGAPHYMPLLVPPGVTFQGLRWWALNQKFQGDQESLGMAVFRTCMPPNGAGKPVITLLAQAGTEFALGDQSGFIDLVPDEVVDNASCTYTYVAFYEPFWVPGEIYLERVRVQFAY